jgi:hypothetical protein
MDAPRLPVHLHPKPDELLSSWLVRLARAHGQKVHTFGALLFGRTATWNRDIDRTAAPLILETLATRTTTDIARIRETTLRSLAGTVFENYRAIGDVPGILSLGIHHRRRKLGGLMFCPHCLRENPYFRVSWRIALNTVCARHEALLCDRCAVCGSLAEFFRNDFVDRVMPHLSSVAICAGCSSDLSLQATGRPDQKLLAWQTRWDNAMAAGVFQLNSSSSVPILEASIVGRHLANLVASGHERMRSFVLAFGGNPEGKPQSLERVDVAERYRRMRIVAHLMGDWPAEFTGACRRYGVATSDVTKGRPLPAWFKSVAECFRLVREATPRSVVREIVDQHWRESGRLPTAIELNAKTGRNDALRNHRDFVFDGDSIDEPTMRKLLSQFERRIRGVLKSPAKRERLLRAQAVLCAVHLLHCRVFYAMALTTDSPATKFLLRRLEPPIAECESATDRSALRRFRRYRYRRSLTPHSLLFPSERGGPLGRGGTYRLWRDCMELCTPALASP